jgi:hypothetical protein
MLQFRAGEGRLARSFNATSYPFVVGSSPSANLVIQGQGVWERHVIFEFDEVSGKFRFSAAGSAIILLNGEPCARGLLRNGDTLQLGSCPLEVHLAPPTQQRLVLFEAGAWLIVCGVALLEIILILVLH